MIEYKVVVDNSIIVWYLNGKRHREDGPAIELSDGTKFWYRNGKLHREDGPASEYSDGTKFWYRNGARHREDGPAIECASGDKFWYLDDINYSESDFNAKLNSRKEFILNEIAKLLGYSIVITNK